MAALPAAQVVDRDLAWPARAPRARRCRPRRAGGSALAVRSPRRCDRRRRSDPGHPCGSPCAPRTSTAARRSRWRRSCAWSARVALGRAGIEREVLAERVREVDELAAPPPAPVAPSSSAAVPGRRRRGHQPRRQRARAGRQRRAPAQPVLLRLLGRQRRLHRLLRSRNAHSRPPQVSPIGGGYAAAHDSRACDDEGLALQHVPGRRGAGRRRPADRRGRPDGRAVRQGRRARPDRHARAAHAPPRRSRRRARRGARALAGRRGAHPRGRARARPRRHGRPRARRRARARGPDRAHAAHARATPTGCSRC